MNHQADVGILVVDAAPDAFERGFESDGQTKEHALLARSLGVSQLGVVVNKLDMVRPPFPRRSDVLRRIGLSRDTRTSPTRCPLSSNPPVSAKSPSSSCRCPVWPERICWSESPTN